MDISEKFQLSPVEQLEWPTTNLLQTVKETELTEGFDINDELEVPFDLGLF